MSKVLEGYLLAFLLLLAFSCNQGPEGEKAVASEAEDVEAAAPEAIVYQVDRVNSVINWQGTEPVGNGHYGTLQIESGELQVAEGELAGGQFVIDMQSIEVGDLQGGRKEKLEGHLRSEDFFKTEAYPTAEFVITGVEKAEGRDDANYLISGNLTTLGETKNIQIPAMVELEEGQIASVTPQFTIDRTQWGIQFRSAGIGTVADKIINDEIGLVINLQAAK